MDKQNLNSSNKTGSSSKGKPSAVIPKSGKKIALWVLTVFFALCAMGALGAGDVLSSLFAALFVAVILPVEPWQALIRKFVKGKLKTVIAVVLAILCFACAGSGTGDTPDIDPNNPIVMNPVIWTNPTTASSSEPTTIPTTNSTTDPTTNPVVPTTDATTEPNTEPSAAPTTEPTIPPEDSTFSIHFIDVGQADAALVECDGHYMLIDGGNKADSSRIYSVLKKAGVEKLDIVVGTHAHEDHIGGLPGAFNYTTADLTLCPVTQYDSDAFEDFAKYAGQKGGGITVPSVGSTYSLGSATVRILGVNGGSDTNDTSIILRIDYGETSFLFTGDAEREAEQAILNSGMNLAATVLKVGHHGSDTSTTYPFLREIMPKYAVISVGEGNSYGHPAEDTLSRLRDADVTVFRTDLQGDIFCISDGKTVTFSVTRNADVDVFSGIGGNSTQTEPPETNPPETEPAQTEDNGRDYVVNTNTGKFHYPSCSSVKKIKDYNRMDFHGTRETLIAQGYKPCGNCHP